LKRLIKKKTTLDGKFEKISTKSITIVALYLRQLACKAYEFLGEHVDNSYERAELAMKVRTVIAVQTASIV